MATIIIPTPFRKFTSNKATFHTTSENILIALKEISLKHPGIKPHLFDEDSKVKSFINIFVDNEDFRTLSESKNKLKEESIVAIIPAIAGGCNA